MAKDVKKFCLTMKLTKQGDVIGSSTKKEGDIDYSKGMECHAFEYEVKAQIDESNGSPLGRRLHKPITIIKEVDASSPKLLGALVTNEVFTAAKISFNRIGTDGKPLIAHTIELANGCICSYRTFHGDLGKEKDSMTQEHTNELEEIQLSFQKITYTWCKGGVMCTDDWMAS